MDQLLETVSPMSDTALAEAKRKIVKNGYQMHYDRCKNVGKLSVGLEIMKIQLADGKQVR